jgi:hypothetical protein
VIPYASLCSSLLRFSALRNSFSNPYTFSFFFPFPAPFPALRCSVFCSPQPCAAPYSSVIPYAALLLRFSALRNPVWTFSTFFFFLRCTAPFPSVYCSIFCFPQPCAALCSSVIPYAALCSPALRNSVSNPYTFFFFLHCSVSCRVLLCFLLSAALRSSSELCDTLYSSVQLCAALLYASKFGF